MGRKTPRAAGTTKKRQSTSGGQVGARGYLVQTLIALLDLLDDQNAWTSVTLEPNITADLDAADKDASDQDASEKDASDQDASDKVDILWRYRDGTRAVQVKSSQNPFRRADLERWAAELEAWQQADQYELVLVGHCDSRSTADIRRVGRVDVPPTANLDLQAFLEQAAHRLDTFLSNHCLPRGEPGYREMLAAAIAERLAHYSTKGVALQRAGLVEQLKAWIQETDQAGRGRTAAGPTLTLLRVFVSAPDEVAEQRIVLQDVIQSLNRIEGQGLGVRLELVPWTEDAAPQIGPRQAPPGTGQVLACDTYVGILATRFGPPAGGPGSATEQEF